MKKVIYLQEVDSTNTFLLGQNLPVGSVAIADFQTSGKGRSGHVWQAKAGENVLMSVVLPLPELSKLFGLQIVSGYAAVDTLLEYVHCYLKWPNDLIVDGKKVAGLLLDTKLGSGGVIKVVSGIGVNVNSFPALDSATSLLLCGATDIDVKSLALKIADKMCDYATRYIEGGLRIDECWHRYSAFIGRDIMFHKGGKKVVAKEKGITLEGYIITEKINGEVDVVSEMEIGYDFSV